ncbi:MAG: uracil-DNA glycosylase [Candidatus Omnitrophica bacterium]|nr:uracil-DNA glycosylase [Candidatus Omnitrophota bacterium]MCF7878471.1 uracil-DNA glycosylase [Candidatus Omnitrophota bacterium]MCF7893270.1 uracil-DNA glycosylase [Candidatus Omnitrophota bacterium]
MDTTILEKINSEIRVCRKCPLGDSCTNHVVGEGNSKADLLFVGEAPGKNEDLTGKPFCGKAGRVLDQLLKISGYKREDIYIANILKCRPPKNRNPKLEEIKLCTPYLVGQLEAIQPKIICCLGNFSVSFIMEKFGLSNKIQPIGKIHGKIFIPPKMRLLKIMPLYHPASVTYNPNMFSILKKDFQMLKNIPV